MGKGGIGFAYCYNTANVDPQPLTHRMLERVEELKEDYAKEDFLKLLHRIAELELKAEHFTSIGGVVDFNKNEQHAMLKAGAQLNDSQAHILREAIEKKFS